MRQVFKVLVSRKELQAVFNHERGNPDIVSGNGRTLLTQLIEQLGIVPRCSLAGIENRHPGPIEKAHQDAFIFVCLGAALETGVQFGQGDKRQEDLLGELDAVHYDWITDAKIAVSVGIEGKLHGQRSGSTWSMASMARSKAGSSTQVPAKSSKSWWRTS